MKAVRSVIDSNRIPYSLNDIGRIAKHIREREGRIEGKSVEGELFNHGAMSYGQKALS